MYTDLEHFASRCRVIVAWHADEPCLRVLLKGLQRSKQDDKACYVIGSGPFSIASELIKTEEDMRADHRLIDCLLVGSRRDLDLTEALGYVTSYVILFEDLMHPSWDLCRTFAPPLRVYKRADTESLWHDCMMRIQPPPPEKTTWNPHPSGLTCVLLEFRRHPWIAGALYNMAHIYGGTDKGLVVVHSGENADLVRKAVLGWKNVRLVQASEQNITVREYEYLLTRARFYDLLFESEFLLIFQTDSLILKPIPQKYFSEGVDYVGAPWVSNGHVGNGGFSLRRRRAMMRICETGPRWEADAMNEDLYFSARCIGRVPPFKEAAAFAVETAFHPDPCALHKVYCYLPRDQVTHLLRVTIPGRRKFYDGVILQARHDHGAQGMSDGPER